LAIAHFPPTAGKHSLVTLTLRGFYTSDKLDPRYVAKLMPRAIYTSGKASTAAGLTASVAKDTHTGTFVVEAGALMQADKVCILVHL